ncbi:hypothetical protein DL96DRAFT_1558534 [Flagelloscypha sp. PMI_526]|nr:hypothetical protein DL96DRAFT_1558534 [Flagelloscypha sp. PMI_526]
MDGPCSCVNSVRLDKDTFEESWWKEDFDAVVVASGRFNVPHIAPIPGLEEWQRRFPDRNSTCSTVTSTEISRDVNAFARQSYLSVRILSISLAPVSSRKGIDSDDAGLSYTLDPGSQNTPILLRRVPANTTMIGEIKMFHPIGQNEDISSGKIELANGSILTGIDYFIMGTGYRYAFPFLPQYHNSSWSMVLKHSHTGKYPAAALARVWSGRASLPSKQKQWEHFWKTVENRGGLKIGFNYLTNAERDENLKYFIAWLNAAALHHGGALLDTPPDSSELWQLWVQARYPVVGVHAHSAFSKDLMTAILHSCSILSLNYEIWGTTYGCAFMQNGGKILSLALLPTALTIRTEGPA